MFSCVTPILLLEGKQVTTVEGLGTLDNPGPMQRAFMEEQAAQCGYCIPGMMMRAQALLQNNPLVSDADIRAALQPNLCRCGTHMRILRAVKRASTADANRRCKLDRNGRQAMKNVVVLSRRSVLAGTGALVFSFCSQSRLAAQEAAQGGQQSGAGVRSRAVSRPVLSWTPGYASTQTAASAY